VHKYGEKDPCGQECFFFSYPYQICRGLAQEDHCNASLVSVTGVCCCCLLLTIAACPHAGHSSFPTCITFKMHWTQKMWLHSSCIVFPAYSMQQTQQVRAGSGVLVVVAPTCALCKLRLFIFSDSRVDSFCFLVLSGLVNGFSGKLCVFPLDVQCTQNPHQHKPSLCYIHRSVEARVTFHIT
jgi:hypothetical protein